MNAEIQRICKHPEFARSKTLQRFLRFTVAETLAGRGELLKEYAIALSVLRRDQDFDPRNSSVVRSQARILRTKLALYYEASPSAVRIEYSPGSYIPTFRLETMPTDHTDPRRMMAFHSLRTLLSTARLEAVEPTRELLEAIAEENPSCAASLAGLSICLAFSQLLNLDSDLGVQANAKGLAMRALAVSRKSSEAWTAMGLIKFAFDWDFDAAGECLDQATALAAPSGATTAFAVTLRGLLNFRQSKDTDPNAGRRELEELGRKDPENALVQCGLAWIAFCEGRYPDSLSALDHAAAISPDCAPVKGLRPFALALQGDYKGARTVGESWTQTDWLDAWLNVLQGRTEAATKMIRRADIGADASMSAQLFRMCILAELGESALARTMASRAKRQHKPYALFIEPSQPQPPLRPAPHRSLYPWQRDQTSASAEVLPPRLVA